MCAALAFGACYTPGTHQLCCTQSWNILCGPDEAGQIWACQQSRISNNACTVNTVIEGTSGKVGVTTSHVCQCQYTRRTCGSNPGDCTVVSGAATNQCTSTNPSGADCAGGGN